MSIGVRDLGARFELRQFHYTARRLVTVREISTWLKVKVKLSLRLTKHHAMKTYWGSGIIAPRIL
jgi:hypothetical protein